MIKLIIKIIFLMTAIWGTAGYWFFRDHADSVVPLMYALIVVVVLGFILLSEKS